MYKTLLTAVAAALLPMSLHSMAAANSPSAMVKPFSDAVSYVCDNNEALTVNFSFNAQGLPEKAAAHLAGQQRTMPINLALSDDTGTVFGEENQYMLSGGYIDSNNYKQSSVMAFSPSSEILYKNCFAQQSGNVKASPAAATMHSSASNRDETVNYACQNNRKVSVLYRFNDQGLPTEAIAMLEGQLRILPINLGRSDDVDTNFGEEGQYMLGTSSLNASNVKQSSVIITSPKNEILFKSCSPIM